MGFSGTDRQLGAIGREGGRALLWVAGAARRKSRQTIQTLVAQTSPACVRVFDVNLRTPFLLERSDSGVSGTGHGAEDERRRSAAGARAAGAAGVKRRGRARISLCGWLPSGCWRSFLRSNGGRYARRSRQPAGHARGVARAPWHSRQVADTIGAGDAFTAAMTHYLLRGADLATLNEAGNRWGAMGGLADPARCRRCPRSVRAGIAAAIEGLTLATQISSAIGVRPFS